MEKYGWDGEKFIRRNYVLLSLKIPPRGHHIFPTSAKKTNIFLEIYKIKAKINDF